MKNIRSVLLAIFLFQTSAHAADKIRIAIPEPNAAYLTFPLAQKKGFLADQGVAAEVISMRGTLTLPMLNNGDIDYLTDISQAVRGVIGGFQVKLVACYLPRSTLVIVGRPEIDSVKALKGKTVAVAGFTSNNFAIMRLIAKHFGLDPEKDVKVLAVGGNEARLAALQGGLVAATVVPPPWDLHAQKLGFHVIAKSHEFFSYPQIGLIAHDRKIKQRPEEIKRVIKAGIMANRYYRSNREETVQFLMDWMRIGKDVAVATYNAFLPALNEDGNCPEDGMRLAFGEIARFAKANREISTKDVADLSILKDAQRELGPAR